MSFIRKVELALCAILILAIIALSGYSLYQRHQVAKLREQNTVLVGDSSAHETYATGAKALTKEKQADDARTQAVLEEHRDWSDAPVPDDVAAILRHSTGSTSAVP